MPLRSALLVALAMLSAGCSIFGDIDADRYRVAGAGGASSGSETTGTGSCVTNEAGVESMTIEQDNDDAELTSSGLSMRPECLSGCTEPQVLWVTDEDNEAAFRFTEHSIPSGAKIVRARLALEIVYQDANADAVDIRAFAPPVAPFDDGHDHQTMKQHAGSDALSSDADAVPIDGLGVMTLDVTVPVQGIVNDPAYQRGLPLGLALDLSGSLEVTEHLGVADSSHASAAPPSLAVEWACP